MYKRFLSFLDQAFIGQPVIKGNTFAKGVRKEDDVERRRLSHCDKLLQHSTKS